MAKCLVKLQDDRKAFRNKIVGTQFLLHTVPALLKKIVPKELLQHVLTLNVAITIFLQERHDLRLTYLPYASSSCYSR